MLLGSVHGGKGYLIRRGDRTVGLSEKGRRDGAAARRYVVAFGEHGVARRVLRLMDPEALLRLDRVGEDYDVTREVRERVAALNNGGSYLACAPVSVSVSNHLHVPKAASVGSSGRSPGQYVGFHVHSVSSTHVFMLPFENNLGVLLPGVLLSEDARELVFECHVIEPSGGGGPDETLRPLADDGYLSGG